MEKFEQDWETCPYCDVSYYEYDTGYREYECGIYKKPDGKFCECSGGSIEDGCPLSFRYEVRDKEEDE